MAQDSGHSPASPNDVISLTSPNNVTIAESDDYATQVLGNPADMNDLDDLDFPSRYTYLTVNGIWSATTLSGGASAWIQHQSYDIVYSYAGERDGVNYPIDTRRFTHLRLRMYASQAGSAVLYWYTAHAPVYAPAGNTRFISYQAGWHIYDVDMTAGGPASTGDWTAQNVSGLRLDAPIDIAGNQIKYDWVRLTPATSQAVNIRWTYQGGASTPVQLFLSPSADPGSGEQLIGTVPAGNGAFTWNSIGISPGTYYIHALMNGARSASGPLYVNASPVLDIDAPSPRTGEDFGYARMNRDWNSRSAFQLEGNIQWQAETPEYLQGRGTNNDPSVSWLYYDRANPIDAARYRYMNMRFYLQAPSPCPTSPWNAGPRMGWNDRTNPFTSLTQTRHILAMYNRWMQVAWDFPNSPLEPGGRAWNSANWNTLRFDQNEDDEATSGGAPLLPDFFRMGQVKLTSIPIAHQGTIRWRAIQGAGVVDLYYDGDRSGYNGTLIQAGVPLAAGAATWNTAQMPGGQYWVYAVAHDSYNSFRQYALAPLLVDHAQQSTLFTDVPNNNTFASDINSLALRGVTAGYYQPDNTYMFRPGASATRGQITKMVALAFSIPESAGGQRFSDVPPGSTFYTYVETLAGRGIISGYQDGTFRPNTSVTRGQLSKIIALSGQQMRNWTLANPNSPTFADVPVGSTFYQHVETLSARGVISGYPCGGLNEPCDGQSRPYFRPGANVTRGQLSKMLTRSTE
ncbi:MAG: S-layer homology domain-containing protein [Chloroflexia bacterium]